MNIWAPRYNFIKKFSDIPIGFICNTCINTELVWESGTFHKRILGLIISVQSFMKHIIMWATPYNTQSVFVWSRKFRTLNFNWETFIQGRKGLFPVKFNCNSPWYWNRLTLMSEIKNTNMRSGEMFAYQQFSQCLILRPCWSWTMKENKNQSVYRWNEFNIHFL